MKLKYILFVIILIATSSSSFATSYTWVGTTSSWNLSSNWSPSGVPDSADNVTISSGTYSPLLDQNRKITNLTLSSKTIDLNGYSLTVYGTATMTSGTVTNGTFYARGNLASFNGTLMDCPVDAICGYIRLSGSTFNETADFTDLGTATGTGAGGCTFNDDVTITHTGTLTYFTLANTTGDTFNGNVTFTNNSNREIHIASSGATIFNGNVILNSTSNGGISFANGGGSATLVAGKTISIGSSGFSADFLTLKNFTQNGSTAQTLTLTGTAVVNMIAATFGGNITVTAPGILIKNSTFNGTTTLTRNGSSGNHQSDGGNMFNLLTLDNAGSSGRIRWATTLPDTYNADATFNSTGQDVQIAYSGDNTFAGNITINSNKVVFNTSTGKVTFTGTNNQTLNGSYNYSFKKLAINKSAGAVTANTTLSVDDSLVFIQGNLITTSTNLLTMKHSSTANGASNSSFVSGPVKKVGNTSFEYPVGKESSYLPLTISAPSTTSSEFVAEYKDEDTYVNSTTRDSTLGYILRDKYWTLQRTSGSSQVYVTLSWNAGFRVMDSLITVASWNGTQWKNLGANPFSGSFVQGSVSGTSTSTSYNEFAIGYLSLLMRTGLSCSDVTNQSDLQSCLSSAGLGDVIQITSGFDLVDDDMSFNLPLIVHPGVTVTGYVTAGNSYPNWWEDSCPLLTSDFKAVYDPANKANMFLFELDNGATIKNLRLRGSNCNYQDFNFDNYLSGGIISKDVSTAEEMNVENCEVSCFSYAGIMTHPQCSLFNVSDSYVHHVKGVGKTTGIGYGIWVMGGSAISAPYYETTLHNNIFDDCKAAIDGQGHPINWNITKWSFSQFFVSEDINRHNSNLFKKRTSDDGLYEQFDYHYCYENALNTCDGATTGTFYGPISNDNVVLCETETDPATNSYTLAWLNFASGDPTGLPIYDVGGINTTINSCIFHKVWGDESASSNINLNFPNRDESIDRYGEDLAQISITENTFAVRRHERSAFVNLPANNKNRGGFARVANNYIDACVFQGDFNTTNNSFKYKPGIAVNTPSPQPCEMTLTLKNNSGTNFLPTGLNFSSTAGQKFIQHVDLSTSIKLFIDEGTLGGSAHSYIIRPNQNNTNTVTSTNLDIISEENYFYDGEIRTADISSGIDIDGYSSPGLYGIDVLSFDATSNPLDFRASSWNHIPVIVKPSAMNTKMLYFNIKDSHVFPSIPVSAIPVEEVYKQVELNGFPIWRESIAEGGNGWEYVGVNLNGDILDVSPTETILSKLNLDGTPNVLSFSIIIKDGETINYSDLKGLMVWIDNVYIPKANSSSGDNAIKDGSIELSNMEKWGETLNDECFWYQPENLYSISCAPLSITSGATGESRIEYLPRDQNGDTLRIAASGAVSMDGKITQNERRSGQQALIIKLIAFENDPSNSCTAYPDNGGNPLVSVATHLDFTDLLTCYDYWAPEYHELLPSGGSSKVGFEPFLYPVTMTTYTKEKFYVGASFTIGNLETLTFTGCDLVFAPGVEITIESGGTLNINPDVNNPITRSHLFSCDEMWQGIIVEDGGSLTINGQISGISERFCTIQNAIKAVHLPGDPSGSSSDVIIRNTIFTDNLVSIYAKDCQVPGTSQISGNYFGVTNALITKEPHLGGYPDNHIYLNNVTDATIGPGSSINLWNYFSGVKMGINAINSDLEVQLSEFENLVDYSVNPSQKGIGINAYSSTATPRSIYVDSRFRNLHRGIFTRGNFDVTIQGCDHFRDIDETAISINSMNYQNTINISDNPQFLNSNIGIRVSGGRLNSVTISNNHFDNSAFVETSNGAFHNTGITVQKWSSTPANAGIVEIFNNTISDFRNGIHAINIKNVRIGGYDGTGNERPNTITYQLSNSALSEAHHGIWVQNCDDADILTNDVINDEPTPETNLRGIVVENSDNANIGCNVIDNVGRAMQFEGFCLGNPGTQLLKNDMTDFEVGIHLENGQIPNQGTPGITPVPWDNKWINDQNIPADHNKVNGQLLDPTTLITWYFQGTDLDDTDPFVPSPRGPNLIFPDDGHTGGTITCMNTNRIGGFERDLAFGSVAADTMSFENYEDELKYAFRNYLYKLLKQNDTLLTLGLPSDSVFQQFFTDMDSTNIGSFGTIRQALDSNLIDTAEFINDNLTESNSIELYRKSVNAILTSKIFEDTDLNESDSTMLENIFIKHWILTGEVVYDVAGILGQEYHSPQISFRKRPNDSTNMSLPKFSKRIVKFSPNPTRDKVTILGTENTSFEIEIIDMYNQVCLRKTNSKEIDLSMFANGIYFIRVLMENVPYSGKLVLLK